MSIAWGPNDGAHRDHGAVIIDVVGIRLVWKYVPRPPNDAMAGTWPAVALRYEERVGRFRRKRSINPHSSSSGVIATAA